MLYSKKTFILNIANLLLMLCLFSAVSCGRQVSSAAKSTDKDITVSKQNVSYQLVVRFKKTISEDYTAVFAKKYQAKVIKSANELNSVILEFSGDKKPEEITKTLNSDPDVDYAEKNSTLSI